MEKAVKNQFPIKAFENDVEEKNPTWSDLSNKIGL